MNSSMDKMIPAKNCTGFVPPAFSLPLIPHTAPEAKSIPGNGPQKKSHGRSGTKREFSLHRDTVFAIRRNDTCHIISESYFYKTGTYYEILRHELEGKRVQPASSAVLDAGVVPVCLERARLAGIPVCEWGISQGYTPLPAILYGLNYFATASEYRVVSDNEEAKEAVRHITNKGKYPFCYQPLEEGAALLSCSAIFGKTAGTCSEVSGIARAVYENFAIPLVTLVVVHDNNGYRLSSLSSARYSHLTFEERSLLLAYLTNQEFL
jgi:hypothetical protein